MTPLPSPADMDRSGLLPRVIGCLVLVAAVFTAAVLLQLRAFEGTSRETERVERLLAASAADLHDAQTGLLTIEAELRRLRPTSPLDRLLPAHAFAQVRTQRVAVERALDRFETRAFGGGPPGGAAAGATEKAVLAEARGGLGALDSLISQVERRETIPAGAVDYTVGAVEAPVARLVDLNRASAERVRGGLEARLQGTRSRTLAGLLLALGTTALAGVFLARSLTARRRLAAAALQERLDAGEAKIRELERASEYKTWFIGQVSHEFRTPLSSIIGFTSLLATEHTQLSDGKRAEYLDIVLRNGRHLLHVINDLLNLSKVEAGTLEVTLSPLRTEEVVTAAATSLRPQAEDRRIRVRFDDASSHLVLADAGRLRQVLLNLLENAIKYSPPGSEVDIFAMSDASRVRIEIRDQGPGIAEEDQGLLFKEFSRIRFAGVKVAGAGLGLALSKRLVELMNGEIGVDTRPGEGSTFWVTLPAAGEIPSSAPSEGDGSLRPARSRGETVAVVDDDEDIRAYAAAVIQRSGYRAVTDPGEVGLADRLAPNGPALILLDLNLEDRSGIDALAEIRDNTQLQQVPVVAFTAATGLDELNRLRDAGFQKFLMKPVEPEALVQAIDDMISELPPPGDESPDDDYLAPLRARFRAGLSQRLRAMEALREQGDASGLAREVHRIRGAAMGYGFTELSESAGEAEEALREQGGTPSHPHVTSFLDRLRQLAEASAE